MHILYYHQHFSTPKGATATRSYEMATHMVAKGHKVTMICGTYGLGETGTEQSNHSVRYGKVNGINVVEFHLPYSNNDGFLKRTSTFFKYSFKGILKGLTTDYDLMFATSTPLTAGIPGIIMKPFRHKPFVFEVRDLWPELPEAMGVIENEFILKMMSGLEWISYHAADRCIGLSPGIREGIIRRGIDPKKVAMIPNGCDLSLFKPDDTKDLSFIEGIDQLDTVAVFTGSHGYANGLDAALDAAKLLKERKIKDIKLLFMGDGAEKTKLRKRAEREGLNNCIFHDPIPKTRLMEWLGKADIGLMLLANVPAFYNGTSPNKFFDYIAAGLPVLNNYPGWLADMIHTYDAGIAIQPEDPEAFANALVELHTNPENKAQKGQNARRLAEEKFDRKYLAEKFEHWLSDTYNTYN